jgi:hypothetical protein
MILGHDLICKLGLDLKFNDETPATIWEDVEVPTWRLDPSPNDKAFATILELPINGCGRYSE